RHPFRILGRAAERASETLRLNASALSRPYDLPRGGARGGARGRPRGGLTPGSTFVSLRILPERFETLETGFRGSQPSLVTTLHDVRESAFELGVGSAERVVGIEVQLLTDPDQHEQQVAK